MKKLKAKVRGRTVQLSRKGTPTTATDLRAKLRPVIDTIVTELVEQAIAGVVETVTARLTAAMRFESAVGVVPARASSPIREGQLVAVALEQWPKEAATSIVDRDPKPEKSPEQASPSAVDTKPRAASVPKGSQIKCTVCGELGHNARRHKGETGAEQIEGTGYETPAPATPRISAAQQAILDRIKARESAA